MLDDALCGKQHSQTQARKTQMSNQSEQTLHIEGANRLTAMTPKFLPEQQQDKGTRLINTKPTPTLR